MTAADFGDDHGMTTATTARSKVRLARVAVIVTGLVPACSSSRVDKISVTPKPTDVSRPSASPAPGVASLTFEVLRADTPRTTARGTSFVAPKDWKIAVRGAATLLEPPEADSRMVLVDVDAKDA